MKKAGIFAIAGAVAAVMLTACGGHGSVVPVSPQTGTTNIPPYSGPAQLASFSWEKDLLKNTVLQGPADPNSTIGMQVLVNQRNSDGLVAYAQSVSDPHSPNYRHFLTPGQIADRFAASEADYQKTAAYFAQYGVHVSAWPQREALFLTGSVAGLQKAFNTTFGIYKAGDQSFIGPEQAPHLSVSVPIQQVVGLVHLQLAHTYVMRPPLGQLRGYAPQQMQRAFDFTGAYSGGFTGTGINVAIVGTGPISSQDAPFLSAAFQAPMAPITQVDVTDAGVTAGLAQGPPSPLPSPVAYPYSSGFQTPPPVTSPACAQVNPPAPLPGCNPEDIEAQLDTQTIASMAPGSNVLFYLGYNPNDCYIVTGVPQNNSPCGANQGYPAEGISLTDPEIQQIIADDTADVVSMSYGLGEPLGVSGYLFYSGLYTKLGYGYGPVEMATMVSEGMAVFASSGDNGAYECGGFGVLYLGNPPCVSYPAGDPNITSVGGVTAPLNDDGTVRTQFTAWGWQTAAGGSGYYANNIGSGGGISTVFTAPSWQAAAGVNTLTGGYRGQPDISMMADPNTAPAIAYDAPYGGEIFAVGGTSLAAPQMAAMWALVLQACKSDAVCSTKGTGPHPYRLGNPAPLLYAVYSNPKQYPAVFDDVTYGDNSASNGPGYGTAPGYQAGKGYDLVTGIGVPYAGHLINAMLTNAGSSMSWNLP